MERIDRLGWAAGMAFSAYGVRVGLRVTRAEALPALIPHLPPGWKPLATPEVELLYSVVVPGPAPRPGVTLYHVLYANEVRAARAAARDDLLRDFERDLSLRLAGESRGRLFLHAGAV